MLDGSTFYYYSGIYLINYHAFYCRSNCTLWTVRLSCPDWCNFKHNVTDPNQYQNFSAKFDTEGVEWSKSSAGNVGKVTKAISNPDDCRLGTSSSVFFNNDRSFSRVFEAKTFFFIFSTLKSKINWKTSSFRCDPVGQFSIEKLNNEDN